MSECTFTPKIKTLPQVWLRIVAHEADRDGAGRGESGSCAKEAMDPNVRVRA